MLEDHHRSTDKRFNANLAYYLVILALRQPQRPTVRHLQDSEATTILHFARIWDIWFNSIGHLDDVVFG